MLGFFKFRPDLQFLFGHVRRELRGCEIVQKREITWFQSHGNV